MNRDPDAYRYKWSNRSKNFQEHLEHFVSEQKTRFQGVFDRLRKKINPDSMDWFELFDIEELPGEIRFALSLRFFFKEAFPFFLSKSLLFLSKSLLFFFVSIRRNTPIYGSEIHIYEWKDPNDQPRNQLFESIGVSIVHLKKWKPF